MTTPPDAPRPPASAGAAPAPETHAATHLATAPQVAPKRHGLSRVWHAFLYSLQGLQAGWHEPAFRQEAFLAVVLVPAAVVLGRTWTETVILIAAVVGVLVVELLNTGIEAAIDRVGPEWHAQSKRAKDTASAAVLLSLLLAAGVWISALWRWLQTP